MTPSCEIPKESMAKIIAGRWHTWPSSHTGKGKLVKENERKKNAYAQAPNLARHAKGIRNAKSGCDWPTWARLGGNRAFLAPLLCFVTFPYAAGSPVLRHFISTASTHPQQRISQRSPSFRSHIPKKRQSFSTHSASRHQKLVIHSWVFSISNIWLCTARSVALSWTLDTVIHSLQVSTCAEQRERQGSSSKKSHLGLQAGGHRKKRWDLWVSSNSYGQGSIIDTREYALTDHISSSECWRQGQSLLCHSRFCPLRLRWWTCWKHIRIIKFPSLRILQSFRSLRWFYQPSYMARTPFSQRRTSYKPAMCFNGHPLACSRRSTARRVEGQSFR